MMDFLGDGNEPLEEIVFSETIVNCRLCFETVSTDQPHMLALGVGLNERAKELCSWPVFSACPRCTSRLETLADRGIFTAKAWAALLEVMGSEDR